MNKKYWIEFHLPRCVLKIHFAMRGLQIYYFPIIFLITINLVFFLITETSKYKSVTIQKCSVTDLTRYLAFCTLNTLKYVSSYLRSRTNGVQKIKIVASCRLDINLVFFLITETSKYKSVTIQKCSVTDLTRYLAFCTLNTLKYVSSYLRSRTNGVQKIKIVASCRLDIVM